MEKKRVWSEFEESDGWDEFKHNLFHKGYELIKEEYPPTVRSEERVLCLFFNATEKDLLFTLYVHNNYVHEVKELDMDEILKKSIYDKSSIFLNFLEDYVSLQKMMLLNDEFPQAEKKIKNKI